jgi:hypothetical protein
MSMRLPDFGPKRLGSREQQSDVGDKSSGDKSYSEQELEEETERFRIRANVDEAVETESHNFHRTLGSSIGDAILTGLRGGDKGQIEREKANSEFEAFAHELVERLLVSDPVQGSGDVVQIKLKEKFFPDFEIVLSRTEGELSITLISSEIEGYRFLRDGLEDLRQRLKAAFPNDHIKVEAISR